MATATAQPQTPPAAETLPVLTHPARILSRATTTELLSVARARATDPSILDEFPPFVWAAEISNSNVDAYGTVMMPSTLRNFAADASAGVAFQDSHRTDGLVRTLGQSLSGTFLEEGGAGARVEADFYTLTGLDPEVDAFVRKARAGIVRDVSVGFYGGEVRCSICGRDMLRDWDCWHIPGVEYEVRDPRTDTKVRTRAVGRIEDAHLAEVSGVYDGATPGCMMLKAQRELEAGRLRPETARLLEARYRIRLPGEATSHRFAGHTPPKEITVSEPESRGGAASPTVDVLALRAALADAGQPADVEPVAGIRALATELARLRPLADEGRTYRADLVADALREGVRAHGQGFAQETYRGLLEAAPLETIKRMRDDWRALADAVLSGGRQTTDGDPSPKTEPGAVPARPAAAFAA